MTEPTPVMLSATTERFVMALYYAYGRSDATRHWVVDPISFAEFYAAQYAEFLTGSISYMPSVQSAFDVYRRSVAS